jgi:hypothetical protein
MKILSAILFFISLLASPLFSQDVENFNKYFLDETMRIDYYHIGNSKEEFITLDQIYKYGVWAGSRVHLMDEMNLGRYCVKIYDAESGDVIYSRGFDSYFGEYKTSSEGNHSLSEKQNYFRNGKKRRQTKSF